MPLYYHLALPLPHLSDAADPLGHSALNKSSHTPRHTLCLTALHRAAVEAFGAASVAHEPIDHATFSPGKRPDIHLPHLHTCLDVKVGSPFIKSLPPALRLRAAHTPLAGTADRLYAKALGRPQRGARSDPPFDPSSGAGYVPADPGEYRGALACGQRVRLLLTEVTGARHSDTNSFLRACTLANTNRLDGAASLTSPRGASFLKRHGDRLSIANLTGLGRALRRGTRRHRSVAQARRRAASLVPLPAAVRTPYVTT